ncbi:flavin reductase family protein [Streptomyces sp. MUM 178J]|uniref:flavin reductase family protein n=1 Tax=Streptomyces sp. MUM 178J TaxID=2791991 RepID=UPI001F04AD8F|nr:flavin reductase family protein [Streptomyces sp. MUM 178J]WRQ78184.1 flavin reductase family protein [Streptomyces sp. MUM 178J]
MGLGQRETGLGRRERTESAERFTEAMSRLVSGVAVVSLRGADGRPCGLLVSSLCSYSVDPPSVLVALARSSRTCRELGTGAGAAFGVHLLARTDAALARVFAGSAEDKFADALWEWDGEVPRLADVPVYVKCRAEALFPHGDHVIVVGEAVHCVLKEGEPLVYFHRRLDWRLGRALPGPPD